MDSKGGVAAAAAAVLAACGVVAEHFGDEGARLVRRASHERPHIRLRSIHPQPLRETIDLVAPIRAHIESFVHEFPGTQEKARDAAQTVACGGLNEVVFNHRLPSESQWKQIGFDAVTGAGITVREGSPAWFALEHLEGEVSSTISSPVGEDATTAQSTAKRLACEWA